MNNITKTEKKRNLEQESNITLTSTSVAIISFFVLLYAQSIVKTNYLKSGTFLTIVTLAYAVATVAVAREKKETKKEQKSKNEQEKYQKKKKGNKEIPSPLPKFTIY